MIVDTAGRNWADQFHLFQNFSFQRKEMCHVAKCQQIDSNEFRPPPSLALHIILIDFNFFLNGNIVFYIKLETRGSERFQRSEILNVDLLYFSEQFPTSSNNEQYLHARIPQ